MTVEELLKRQAQLQAQGTPITERAMQVLLEQAQGGKAAASPNGATGGPLSAPAGGPVPTEGIAGV